MKSLRLALEEAGCVDVHTYIQSGNVVFRSALRCRPFVRAAGRGCVQQPWLRAARACANAGRAREGGGGQSVSGGRRRSEKPPSLLPGQTRDKTDLKSLEALKTHTERFVLKGRIFYLHTPDGFGTSKLAKRAERLLGVDATARNWRTVKTLLAMAKKSGDVRVAASVRCQRLPVRLSMSFRRISSSTPFSFTRAHNRSMTRAST